MIAFLLQLAAARGDGVGQRAYLNARLEPFGLDVHDFAATGRGVRTTRARSPAARVFAWGDGEVVFAERALARRGDLAAAAAEASTRGAPLTDESVLACYIVLEERDGRDDRFFLWRDTLPAAPASALALRDEDLALLPRCYAECARATRAYVLARYDECNAVLSVPEDRFVEAFAHVRARSFALDAEVFRLEPASADVLQAPGTRRALVPLLDLLNHKHGARVRVERHAAKWQLVSAEGYAAGAEVFNDYGNRSNLELLLHYGFAVPDNDVGVVGFDAVDVVEACAAARPAVFDGDAVRSVGARLLADEAARRSERAAQRLGLYTVDVAAGAAPGDRLRSTLATLEALAAASGDGDAAALPGDVVAALLDARRAELAARLTDAAGAPEAAPCVAAFLKAEWDALPRPPRPPRRRGLFAALRRRT